jgi:nitrous oxidase accessory protein
MLKRMVFGIMVTMLLMGTLASAFNVQRVKARTIIVPDNYPTIEEAVNAANPGDTIYVKAGIYHEPINVTKSVSLVGENRKTTLIDKGIIIRADGVTVNGFTISNNLPGDNVHGVWIESSECLITNNILVACRHEGIFLDGRSGGANENVVTNNYIVNNSDCGVLVWGGSDNTIGFNTITNNFFGVYFYSPGSNTTRNLVEGNEITNNQDAGVVLDAYSSGNAIIANNVSNNGWKGFFWTSGIAFAQQSEANQIVSNTIMNNKIGISQYYFSNNNTLHHNSFINNAMQVYNDATPPSVNIWDDGYPSGGNYWSDYNGTDVFSGPYQNVTGSDGIGDKQYTIDANNIDHYPLMNTYVPLVGDINSDGKVDMKDVGIVAQAFGSFCNDPRWNPFSDMDKNGIIDLRDIALVAKNFGKHHP